MSTWYVNNISGDREKCKDQLINSLKSKQTRTDAQIKQLREVRSSDKNWHSHSSWMSIDFEVAGENWKVAGKLMLMVQRHHAEARRHLRTRVWAPRSSGINGAKSCILGLSWHLISLIHRIYFNLKILNFTVLKNLDNHSQSSVNCTCALILWKTLKMVICSIKNFWNLCKKTFF